MFDIQSKYKKLILTNISMKLALYFLFLCWQSFITELMLDGNVDALRCQYDTE